ncbi:MAG: hypothetical protein C4576_25170 [Desulfobacteraceae bacterium]|nr:MAG: hypothetical protein C4576_25170 [Desulfobacteraceae bacterium]
MPDLDNHAIFPVMVGRGVAESLLKSFHFVWITIPGNAAECMELPIRAGVEKCEQVGIQFRGFTVLEQPFQWEQNFAPKKRSQRSASWVAYACPHGRHIERPVGYSMEILHFP